MSACSRLQFRARLWLFFSFLIAAGAVAGSVAVLVSASQQPDLTGMGVVSMRVQCTLPDGHRCLPAPWSCCCYCCSRDVVACLPVAALFLLSPVMLLVSLLLSVQLWRQYYDSPCPACFTSYACLPVTGERASMRPHSGQLHPVLGLPFRGKRQRLRIH